MSLVKGLTTAEAAQRIGRTLRHVQWLIKEGRLPAERVGRDYFIRADDLKLVTGLKRGRPPKQATVAPKSSGEVRRADKTGQKLNEAFRRAAEEEQKASKKRGKK